MLYCDAQTLIASFAEAESPSLQFVGFRPLGHHARAFHRRRGAEVSGPVGAARSELNDIAVPEDESAGIVLLLERVVWCSAPHGAR